MYVDWVNGFTDEQGRQIFPLYSFVVLAVKIKQSRELLIWWYQIISVTHLDQEGLAFKEVLTAELSLMLSQESISEIIYFAFNKKYFQEV